MINEDNTIQVPNVNELLPPGQGRVAEVKLKKEISQNPSVGQIVPAPEESQDVELTALI